MVGWSDLQTTIGQLTYVRAEQVDNRHQLWFRFQGDSNSYFLYLDENKDVALIQADLLRDAVTNNLAVTVHWQTVSVGRKTYAIRLS